MTRWPRVFWAHRVPIALLFVGVSVPLAVVASFGERVRAGSKLPFDLPILRYMREHGSPAIEDVMVAFTEVGRLVPMVLITVVLAAVLAWRRRFGRATFVLVAGAGSVLINVTVKAAYRRDRPTLWESILPETTYSFPSGHAMASMTLACTLIVVAWPTRWHWPVIALGALFTFLVGASRVYLGVHYPSDVLAGWLAALAWVAGLYLVLEHWPNRLWRGEMRETPHPSDDSAQ